MSKKTTEQRSKATIVRQRNRRIDALYTLRGYRPPEIVDILTDEGLFVGVKRDSALRMVQSRVQECRAQADPAINLALQRPAERERYIQQVYAMMRRELEVIENDEMLPRERTTAKGDVFTVLEPRYTEDEKGKARKQYAALAEKLAMLNGVDVKGETIGDDEESRKNGDEQREPFQIVMTGSDIDALIAANLEGGGVN